MKEFRGMSSIKYVRAPALIYDSKGRKKRLPESGRRNSFCTAFTNDGGSGQKLAHHTGH